MRGAEGGMRRPSTVGRACLVLLAAAWLGGYLYESALADEAGSHRPPTLTSGAVELGVAGSMTTVEGITSGSLLLRGGLFREALAGLGAVELSVGFRHVSSLDEAQLEAVVSWQRRFRETANYPYVAVGGGWRREEIGSFGQSRYPFGFGLGVRSLLGRRAGFRVEYRFRRIFNDPVSDFSEHHVMLGLSVFFRNVPGNP